MRQEIVVVLANQHQNKTLSLEAKLLYLTAVAGSSCDLSCLMYSDQKSNFSLVFVRRLNLNQACCHKFLVLSFVSVYKLRDWLTNDVFSRQRLSHIDLLKQCFFPPVF